MKGGGGKRRDVKGGGVGGKGRREWVDGRGGKGEIVWILPHQQNMICQKECEVRKGREQGGSKRQKIRNEDRQR